MAEPPRDFQPGRPLRDELTAARLNQILAAIRRSRPLPGRGIGVYETGAGTRIDVLPGGGRRSKNRQPPFMVEVRQDPAAEGVFKAGVVYDSKLFASLAPADILPITGLLTSPKPEADDDGWFQLEDPDLIWLEVTFEDGEPSATIKHLNTGTFDPEIEGGLEESYFEAPDGASGLPEQTVARKLIASYADGVLTPWTDRHQVLVDMIINGVPVVYPVDHSGGYVPPLP